MKIYNVLFLLIALFLAACSSPTANTANTTAVNVANTAAVNTADTTTQNQSPIAASAVSPSETMKAMSEAGRIRDTAALKTLVSKATLTMMEANAKKQNTTVDELLKKGNSANDQEPPAMRNENIKGDTATIEIKDKTSEKWTTMPLVKEDGAWRVAIDKYIETLAKRTPEDAKKPAADSNKQAKTGKSKTNK